MRLRVCVAAVAAVAAVLVAATTLGSAAPAWAGKDDEPPTDPSCEASSCSVRISLDGTAVDRHGGSAATVPPDCWYSDWQSVERGFFIRVVKEVLGWFFPTLDIGSSPLRDYRQALRAHRGDDDWRWYRLHCKDGINTIFSEQALSVAQNTEWFGQQIALQDLLVGPSTEVPAGVSVETLLEVAQDAFTIPDPEVAQSPRLRGLGGATLVNLDTWLWADNAQETHTITASAGPVSVSLTAENTGYLLTSPFGSTECTHEQFTTAWSPRLAESPDSGCTIAFDRPSPPGSAGHEVQVTSQWDVTWTATGLPGTHTLEGLTPTSTITVPVAEAGATVDRVD